MAAGVTPDVFDPKVALNTDVLLQSGDPPTFTADDAYTAPAEAGVKIVHAWAVNVLSTNQLLRIWYTESGGARDKIFQNNLPGDFKPYILDFLVGMILNPGDIIEFASDSATAIRIHVSVIEMKD